jgi:acyl phosphate:glycerol-3-phosphate acyltransferase
MLYYIFAASGGYLLGSIPFGLVITRAAGLGDVRQIGSGNIGATNVLRTGRKDLVAGFAAYLGHCFPVWLSFKGGKGVATFFGVLFAGIWPLGMVAGITWLAVATIFRFSSLASLSAAAIAPVMALIAGFSWSEIVFTLLLAALIFWRHSSNIARLIAGTEPKIGANKEDGSAPPPGAATEPPASAE